MGYYVYLLMFCLFGAVHGMQDLIPRDTQASTAIFLAWKDRPVPELTIRLPAVCGLCQYKNAFYVCVQCNVLFFGSIEDTFNERGEIYAHPFSNFYSQAEDRDLQPLRVEGLDYVTSEHYYQAARAAASNVHRAAEGRSVVALDELVEIAIAPSPGKAWYKGKGSAGMISLEEEIVIMKQALSAKFGQHIYLKRMLLATQNAWLIYRADRPSPWSVDQGNLLGILLMDLRTLLQEQEQKLHERMQRLLLHKR